MLLKKTTYNERETMDFGREIASKIRKGDVIYLEGELGSGKTTLVKGIMEGLNIAENITSPTYAIIEEHRSLTGNIVYHFDLYRLEQPEDIVHLGLEIYFTSESIVLIEWPERGLSFLPKAAHKIILEYKRENVRKIFYHYVN